MLKYQENSENLKVSFSELKEQLEPPKEAGSIMQIFQLARSGRTKVSSILSGKEGYTTERIGGAGKVLSGSDTCQLMQ